MTREQIIKAIEVAAQDRISKMFDVLCTEMANARDDYQSEVVARFASGLRNIRKVASAAIAAIPEEDES